MAVFKSAILPGLGQIGKGYKLEGYITMGSEGLLLSVATGCYIAAQDDLAAILDTKTSTTDCMEKKNNYDVLHIANITCLSAAGVIYVYNLVRAYSLMPRYKDSGLTFAPTIIPTNDGFTSGLNLTFKF